MSKPRIYMTFLGAGGNDVTGSRTLLGIENANNKHRNYFGLIDYGIFQGENEKRNFNDPIKSEFLDFVILTHSHGDHCLGIPLLRDYKGKIYATQSTIDHVKPLLYDAANIYETNAAKELGFAPDYYYKMKQELISLGNHKNHERYFELSSQIEEVKSRALYTIEDVDNIIKHLQPVFTYNAFEVAPKIYARIVPSSHKEGSGIVEIYVGEYGEHSVNIAFSGDIGPGNSLLYKSHNHSPNPLITHCVMESLHGAEEQVETPEEAYQKLKQIVVEGTNQGKSINLLGKNELALYFINRMIDETGLCSMNYFDAPLAYKELLLYKREYDKKDDHWFKNLGTNPFDTSEFIILKRHEEHMEAIQDLRPRISLTSSVWGTGGRVIDYFAHDIEREDAIFVFLSWLSPDCPSSILHNAKEGEKVKINGVNYVKKCQTHQLTGFTQHGYFDDYIKFIEMYPKRKHLVLFHATEDAKANVTRKIKENGGYEFGIHSPQMYDSEENCYFELTADSFEEISPFDGYAKFSKVLCPSFMDN